MMPRAFVRRAGKSGYVLAWWQQGTFTALHTSIRRLPKDRNHRPARPHHTWLRTIEADLQPPNTEVAEDRGRWR